MSKAALHFPTVTVVRFMCSHHILSTFAIRPDRTAISGGSQQHIDAVMKIFPQARVHLKTKIIALVPVKMAKWLFQEKMGQRSLIM